MGRTARGLQRMRVALDPVPRPIAEAVPGHATALGQVRRADVARQIREQFTTAIGRDASVHFVGVWDTVDSVGLPGLRKRITSSATITGKRFRHVRHALALDEHRRQFLPRPYIGTADPGKPDVDPGQTLKQLWFRGVHTDIGGGRPIALTRMSSETMHWMVTEARSIGLRCPDVPVAADPLPEVIGDQLRAQPLWALTGMAVRDPRLAPAGTVAAAGDVLGPGAPVHGAGAFTWQPLEHPSVEQLSPARAGQAPTTPPGSPWARGNGPRLQAWLTPLGIAAVLAVIGAIAGGPWRLLVVVAAAIVLARVVARAFGRLTMWRRVGDPAPRWQPAALGLGYPALVLGGLVLSVVLLLTWNADGSLLRDVLLVFAAVAAGATAIGAILVISLVARWLVREVVGR